MHTFFLLLVLILAGVLPLCATNYTFNVPSGDWNVASNWLPVGVPGAGDDVIINAGTITLTFDVSVNNLTQNGGILQGLGAINVAGDLIWHKGDFDNQGTITVSGSLMSVNPSPGTSSSNLNRRYGALILNGGGTLENPKMTFLNGADLEVMAGTTLTIDATSLANFTSISVNSTGSTLNFQGNIVKNGPKGFSLSNSEFTLSNHITINQGVLGIGGNPSNIVNLNGCTVNMTTGTTFRMNPGTLNLSNTTFLGSGTFDASVGTVNINSGNTFPTVTVFNLTINSNGVINTNQNITIRTISVNSGTLSVCSSQNLTISFNLTNASRIKGFGSITIEPGAVFNNTGTVAAGCSTGTLTFIGNYSNSIMDFEVEEAGGTPSADLLNVTGNMTLGGTLNIQYLGGNIPPGTYDIITCTGTRTGTFTNINYPANCNGNCSVVYTANKAQLVITAVLPLELLSFTARAQEDDILLEWHTTTETRVHDFDIERSLDGSNWQQIGVQVAKNNPTTQQQYLYTDANAVLIAPNDGSIFYRFKINDWDGKFEYSPLAYVLVGRHEGLQVWPNPATADVMLERNTNRESEQELRVYSSDGKLMFTQTVALNKGINLWTISITGWPSGVYRIMFGGESLVLVKL